MVSSDTDSDSGFPDPDNVSNSDISLANDELIFFGNNEEDDIDNQETIQFDQYQPLPIEDSTDSNRESSDDEVATTDSSTSHSDIPPIVPIEDILLKEVWSGAALKTSDIEMDKQKVDEVKQAMANIVLPSSSIPDWATKIPEEHWKQELLERIEKMKRNS